MNSSALQQATEAHHSAEQDVIAWIRRSAARSHVRLPGRTSVSNMRDHLRRLVRSSRLPMVPRSIIRKLRLAREQRIFAHNLCVEHIVYHDIQGQLDNEKHEKVLRILRDAIEILAPHSRPNPRSSPIPTPLHSPSGLRSPTRLIRAQRVTLVSRNMFRFLRNPEALR